MTATPRARWQHPVVSVAQPAPPVTVIVPFRSDSSHLRECLAHLERQTYRAFDVILVPDATSACGGPGVTPAADSERQRAGGAVFAAALVTAGTRHRYVAESQRDVDALPSCNLLIRRETFLRDADASSRVWPGEDILACVFATRNGDRIVYDPEALVYHHRRDLFAPHVKQVWNYGRFRGDFLRRFDRTWRDAPYFVPAAFVAAHAVLLPLAMRKRSRGSALAAIGTYAVLVALSAVREARVARADPLLVAAGIYVTHMTYGTGTISGWLRGRARDD